MQDWKFENMGYFLSHILGFRNKYIIFAAETSYRLSLKPIAIKKRKIMEIRQLKYFLKVAETLNFSEASRKLYITQSTLSQQISHLEQEIGLPLFERNSHEVYLTEAGKELDRKSVV